MKFSEKLVAFESGSEIFSREIADPSECDSKITQKKLDVYLEGFVRISSSIFGGQKRQLIGLCSYMNDGGYINSNVFIGRYCSIGRRVSIGAGLHNINGLTSSPFSSEVPSRPYSSLELQALNIGPRKKTSVIVENDVWIGDGAVLLNGVRIGTGAVIGANSVITKDVRPYEIVGGVPAKKINRRFPDEICNRLLSTQWWEYDIEFLKKLPIRNIFQFLEEFENLSSDDFFKSYETFCLKRFG